MILSSRVWSLCLLGVLFAGTPAADAALVISIGSVTIPAGGTGTVDVMISTTSGTQLLTAYGFEFEIMANQGTVLEFADPQSSSELTNPNYVFFPSGGVNSAPIGLVGPGTTYIGSNISNSISGETVTTTPQLLATLDLTAITGTPPNPGDTFTITLVTPDLETFFFDDNGDDIAFTANTGIITMGASTVPEPASLLLAGLAFGGIGAFQIRRRKTPASS